LIHYGRPDQGNWEKYKSNVNINSSCIIAPDANINYIIHPDKKNLNLVVGENSHIYSVFNFVQPNAQIHVGNRCQLGNVNFVASTSITVGDDVLMAWGINILDSDHHSIFWEERKNDVMRCREDYILSNGRAIGQSHDWSCVEKHPVFIGNKCWIGINVIILKGVTIGEGAIIAAGSVVFEDVPPWCVAAGNPCRIVKKTAPNRQTSMLD